jgi:pyrophosphatase PpaX
VNAPAHPRDHSPATPLPGATAGPERLRELKAVLFDLDGTLIDTIELIKVSFRHATRTVLGREYPDEVTMRNVGQPLLTQFRDIAPGHEDELLRVYREFNMAHHDEMAKAYPGTLEALDDVRRAGLPIGVVTSKGTAGTTKGIALFGLAPYLDVVVTADDVDVHKPDPHPLRVAAGLLGVELGYCMYVGDSPHDMQAAVAGGAIAVAALWGAFPREEVVVPGTSYALDSIRELPGLLAEGID